jgi:hypothetical protein
MCTSTVRTNVIGRYIVFSISWDVPFKETVARNLYRPFWPVWTHLLFVTTPQLENTRTDCCLVMWFIWGLLDRSTARYFYEGSKTILHKPTANIRTNLSVKNVSINNIYNFCKPNQTYGKRRGLKRFRIHICTGLQVISSHFYIFILCLLAFLCLS